MSVIVKCNGEIKDLMTALDRAVTSMGDKPEHLHIIAQLRKEDSTYLIFIDSQEKGGLDVSSNESSS